MVPPVASAALAVPQHLRALNRANEVRLARADVKRRLSGDEITLEEAMADPATQTMGIAELILTRRRWGRQRTLKLLSRVPVSETKPVGALTDRQRAVLLALGG